MGDRLSGIDESSKERERNAPLPMWIKKLHEFGDSGYGHLNFLWKDDKRPIYIMDNHLAALWCWLQEIKPEELYRLIHIDHHWDALDMSDASIEVIRKHDVTNIDDFLALRSTNDKEFPLVRWDNYIDPMRALRPNYTQMYFHAFQQDTSSRVLDDEKVDVSSSPEWWGNLGYWESELETDRVIINFDLDYFFLAVRDEVVRAFSDEFVRAVCERFVKPLLRPDTVLTIAWSPDCCGGWPAASQVSAVFCKALRIAFPANQLQFPLKTPS